VRDTLVWLELRLFGPSAFALRAVSLLLYIGAALLLRAYLRRALPGPSPSRPPGCSRSTRCTPSRSPGWRARRTSSPCVLVAAALLVYARERQLWAVPLLLLGGRCSASRWPWSRRSCCCCTTSCVGRRAALAGVGASLAAPPSRCVVHLRVGRAVGMMAAWPGGSRLTALTTMGPVWLRYLGECFVPVGLSVHHDVPARAAGDPLAWLATRLSRCSRGRRAAARRGQRLWLGRSAGSCCRSCPPARCWPRCRT
jgi:hypothetical protein